MWSSQRYIEIGKALGHPADLLENAVDQIERVIDAPHCDARIVALEFREAGHHDALFDHDLHYAQHHEYGRNQNDDLRSNRHPGRLI